MESRLRIGLIGAGPWGKNYISAISNLHHKYSFKAIVSKSLKDSPPGVKILRKVGSIFDENLDCLVVASAPTTHVDITAEALSHGVNVLVEKPLAFNVYDVDRIHRASRQSKCLVKCGYIDLANPALLSLLDKLTADSTYQTFEGAWCAPGPYRTNCSPLWDWGPHPLAVACKVFGNNGIIKNVKQLSSDRGALYQVEASFNGVPGSFVWGNGAQHKARRLSVTTSNASYLFDGLSTHQSFKDQEAILYPAISPLENQLNIFHEILLGKTETYDDLELSLTVTTLLCSIQDMITV